MNWITVLGLIIPFIGTSLGSFSVFFLKKGTYEKMHAPLLSFTAGIMTAASFWSLLVPAIEKSSFPDAFAFVPAAIGFIIGMALLMLTDRFVPETLLSPSGNNTPKKTAMLVIAVILHNIPEGMAVGAVFAASSSADILRLSAAIALPVGIAIQNFPEGAIISMPLAAEGIKKGKACIGGILSGIVEPIAGFITVLLSGLITPLLPYLLGFAAGAMMFVVTNELLSEQNNSIASTVSFTFGFVLMMALDAAFG